MNKDSSWSLRFEDIDSDTITTQIEVKDGTATVNGFSITDTGATAPYTHLLVFTSSSFNKKADIAKGLSKTYSVTITYGDGINTPPATYTTTVQITNVNRVPALSNANAL